MPFHLSPKPRRASASSCHPATCTDSSPLRVRTTSPVATTQSPRLSAVSSSNRSVPFTVAISWIGPLESRSVANASLPIERSSITRPATVAVTPLPSPSAQPGVGGLEVGGPIGDLDPVRGPRCTGCRHSSVARRFFS